MTQKERLINWIAALRSGDYKQGQGCLRGEKNQFCCLGVAADLILNKWTYDDFTKKYWWNDISFLYGTLKEEALHQYGMTHEDQQHLAQMNDDGDYAYTFYEIANYIEETILTRLTDEN